MKRLLIIILAAVAVVTANAQLLWRISGNGIEKPSYLLGTHHIAPADMLERIAGFADALAAVDGVLGEVDMAKMQSPETQMAMMRSLQAPADSALTTLLSEAQLDSIGSMLAAHGLPVDVKNPMVASLKPVAIATMLSAALASERMPGYDPQKQLDRLVQELALQQGKSAGGLESVESQLKMLFETPLTEQAEDLMEMVRNQEESMAMAQKMADAYLAGDLETLYSLITDEMMGLNADRKKRMLDDRNSAWAEFLIGLLPTASVMIVVGAGHLPGKNGLIEMLRTAGYTVEPVKTEVR